MDDNKILEAADVVQETLPVSSDNGGMIVTFVVGLVTGIGGTLTAIWAKNKIKAKKELIAAEADDDLFEDEVDPS